MSDMIIFNVPLEPKGQMRARAGVQFTQTGKAFAQTYKASEQKRREQKFVGLIYKHAPKTPFKGRVMLGVKAYKQIPKSKSKKFKAAALAGEIRPMTKPDLSNIIKHVEDCMNDLFWEDDKQIVGYLPGTGQYYAERAYYRIAVQPLEE